MSRLSLLIVLVLATGDAVAATPDSTRVGWRLGAAVAGGVDSFAQTFQITDTVQSDLLLDQRALRDTTEVFTEFRLVGEASAHFERRRHRFLARGRVSSGTDLLRGTLLLEGRAERDDRSHRFDARVEVEGRQFREDSDFALSSDVLETEARLHWRHRPHPDFRWGILGRGEMLRYADPGEFEVDQDRGDLSVTATVTRGWDWSLDVDAGGGVRHSPGSSTIPSYDRGFLRTDLAWTQSLHWSLETHAAVERREYRDTSVRSPYTDLLLEPSMTWSPTLDWRFRLSTANEWLLYDTPTEVYFDFWLGSLGLEARRSLGAWEVSLEPRWSWLASEVDTEDAYVQPSLLGRVEWFPSSAIWLSLSGEFGQRDYVEPGAESLDLYSDYLFLRTTLLLSWSLRDGLSADVFLSDEPESHRQAEDDSRLTLLTASLRAAI